MTNVLKWLLGLTPEELSAGDSWRIGLAAERSNYVILTLMAVLAGMVYLTVRSYRREGEAPRRVKTFLTILRVIVIVLALLVLLRPAVLVKRINVLRSTVVFLVDDSHSMAEKDTYAKSPHRERLAKFENLQPAELGQYSRMDLVRKALLRKDGALAELARQHRVVLLAFSTASQAGGQYTRTLMKFGAKASSEDEGSDQTLADEAVRARLEDVLKSLRAKGIETNLARALGDALESDALPTTGGGRVAGIVMISDGQATSKDARGIETAISSRTLRAAQRGWPLLGVLVGDDQPPTNLTVTAMEMRDRVSRKSELLIKARVLHRNLGGQSVTAQLWRRRVREDEEGRPVPEAWSDVGEPQQIDLVRRPAPDFPEDKSRSVGSQTVTFTADTPEAGQFEYKVAVVPVPGERYGDDNETIAGVTVTDERINVLLVSADAGWEFQYLRNILLRQDDLFRVGVWQQNADPDVNQLASAGMALKELPGTMAELVGSPGGKPHPGFRVVILYDPEPSHAENDRTRGMTPLMKLLERFVSEHGGGLCYIAGNKNTDFLLDPKGPFQPLVKMLPVELRANTLDVGQRIAQRQPVPWPVRLTSYGMDHAITALGHAGEEAKDIWPLLPGVFWSHPVHRVKPLGRVLAESSNALRRMANGDPEPVIVARPYGTGRVVYLGTQATWRWRYLQDGRYHRKFWINLAQYLASPKARQVTILAGGDRFDAGKPIKVEVQAYDDEYKPLEAKTFPLRITPKDTEDHRVVELKPGKEPGSFALTVPDLLPGTYVLSALWDDKDRKEKVKDKVIVIRESKVETERPEANPAMLQRVVSEQQYLLRLHEIDKLTDLIHSDPRKAPREDKHEIWDSNLMLVLIVLLLTIEWIVRKKHNMT